MFLKSVCMSLVRLLFLAKVPMPAEFVRGKLPGPSGRLKLLVIARTVDSQNLNAT